MENPMEKIYIFRATPILGNLMKPPSPHVGSHKRPTSSGTSVKSSFFGTDQGGDQCLPLDSPHWSCGKGQRKSIIFGCFWGYDLQVVDPKCLTHSNTLSLLNAENAGSKAPQCSPFQPFPSHCAHLGVFHDGTEDLYATRDVFDDWEPISHYVAATRVVPGKMPYQFRPKIWVGEKPDLEFRSPLWMFDFWGEKKNPWKNDLISNNLPVNQTKHSHLLNRWPQ